MPKKMFEVDRRSLKRLQNQMRSTGKEVHKNITKELQKSMQKVKSNAESAVPVDTGKLKASGEIRTSKRGDNFQEVVVTFGKGLDYAAKVHELHKTKSKFLEKRARQEAVRFSISANMGKMLREALENASRKR